MRSCFCVQSGAQPATSCAEGKPALPRNLCCYLEGYLWLHYKSLTHTAEEDIIASIDMFSVCDRPVLT